MVGTSTKGLCFSASRVCSASCWVSSGVPALIALNLALKESQDMEWRIETSSPPRNRLSMGVDRQVAATEAHLAGLVPATVRPRCHLVVMWSLGGSDWVPE